MEVIGTLLAISGAGMILFALVYVNLLIGGLVNAMVTLMAGPIIDRFVKNKE